MSTLLFILSFLTFSLSINYLMALKKPGVYPPKFLLKKRIRIMGICSTILLFLGIVVKMFQS